MAEENNSAGQTTDNGTTEGDDNSTLLTGDNAGDQDASGTPPQDGDDKSTDQNDSDDSNGDKDAEDDNGAPETYEAFSLPDGFEIPEAELNDFTDVARELDLSQEQAQQLVDLESKRMQSFLEAQEQQRNDEIVGWVDKVKEDKEIGGAKLDESLATAKKGLEAFASDALKDLLELPDKDNPTGTGLGNHPEIIRMFAKVGALVGEDGVPVSGGAVSGKSRAETLYPDQGK